MTRWFSNTNIVYTGAYSVQLATGLDSQTQTSWCLKRDDFLNSFQEICTSRNLNRT